MLKRWGTPIVIVALISAGMYLLVSPSSSAQSTENQLLCGDKNVVFFDRQKGMMFKFLGFGTTEKIFLNDKKEMVSGIALAFTGPDNKRWAFYGPGLQWLWITDDFSKIFWLSNSSVVKKTDRMKILDTNNNAVLFNLDFLKCE
jgi:hypothetical protein